MALFKRLELGVPEAALWFTQPGLELTRGELLRLWQGGLGCQTGGSKGARLHAVLAAPQTLAE